MNKKVEEKRIGYDEFLKDNFELILKKYRDPTINFKLLRQCSNDFVKEIIGV